MRNQFWDTSAFVSLLFQEPYTPRAMAAREAAERYFAWDGLVLESWAALIRRGSTPTQERARGRLLGHFALQVLGERDQAVIQRAITRHRLRSADAGHLICLKQARRLVPDIVFVCCDEELVRAARAERIEVWG